MIRNGTVVSLAYSLTNKKGDVLDKADAADPFNYLHGAHQIVPGLENALEGLKKGDKKKGSSGFRAASRSWWKISGELPG